VLTVVIYDTKFGNTAKVADAIARGAGARGSVKVGDTAEADRLLAERPDLVVIGGPTQRRGPSPALRACVDALSSSLRDVPVAAFDTRYRGATWLMGSAASDVSKRLGNAGARLAAPSESFFITRDGPPASQGLEAGELLRAETWGRLIATAAPSWGVMS
jgi:flavodoxin